MTARKRQAQGHGGPEVHDVVGVRALRVVVDELSLQLAAPALEKRSALGSGGLSLVVRAQQRLHAPLELCECLFKSRNGQFWQRVRTLVLEHGAGEEGGGG